MQEENTKTQKVEMAASGVHGKNDKYTDGRQYVKLKILL
jgi:hypothetical protein